MTDQREYTVVVIMSVIVKAENEDDAVQRAQVPFLHGLVPHMGKFLVNGVRETIPTDRDPIDFEKLKKL